MHRGVHRQFRSEELGPFTRSDDAPPLRLWNAERMTARPRAVATPATQPRGPTRAEAFCTSGTRPPGETEPTS
ncbi:MAG: hypothetical protein D6725_09495 [Planctomycetota bacterium]|nr:MAG: hypothetical protein D6725_09495 [Planctomycetota bacterium]